MEYADYDYYVNEYKGELPQETFERLIIKSSRIIDNNINCILTEKIIEGLSEQAQEQLKYTACALLDLINSRDKSQNRQVNSISIDGVSKNFVSISNAEYKQEVRGVLGYLPNELICYI